MAEAAVVKTEPFSLDDLPVADLGTISIRVFVLPPKPKQDNDKEVQLPLDCMSSEHFGQLAW